ncbi:MAG: hypothetical protein N6V49_11920 [Serratia symbiotica]|nr:hypothetical protein [Serratia symbiotica]
MQLYPKKFALQEIGNAVDPQVFTPLNDGGERGRLTHKQCEV